MRLYGPIFITENPLIEDDLLGMKWDFCLAKNSARGSVTRTTGRAWRNANFYRKRENPRMTMKLFFVTVSLLSLLTVGCSKAENPQNSSKSVITIQEIADLPTTTLPTSDAVIPKDIRPYTQWVSNECFSLEGDLFNTLYTLKDTGLHSEWYGVPEFFPFSIFDERGLVAGESIESEGGAILCDEPWAIATQFYSAALSSAEPDGTVCVLQWSNLSQLSTPDFESNHLEHYRWTWAAEDAEPFPIEPCRGNISLQVAVMNYNAADWLSPGNWNHEAYQQLSFFDRVVLQNEWATYYGNEIPEWHVPVESRYFHITGLTILNGNSRSEAEYFRGSRAREIRIIINDEYETSIHLQDTPAPQLIPLDYTQHTTEYPVDIQIKIVDTYAGTTEDVYISEIGIGIESNLPQGH